METFSSTFEQKYTNIKSLYVQELRSAIQLKNPSVPTNILLRTFYRLPTIRAETSISDINYLFRHPDLLYGRVIYYDWFSILSTFNSILIWRD